MTGRTPPPARAGRQERTEGGRGLLPRVELGGGRTGGRGLAPGIELRTADERDCQSDLPHLLPAVVVITRSAYLKLKLSPAVPPLMNYNTVQSI